MRVATGLQRQHAPGGVSSDERDLPFVLRLHKPRGDDVIIIAGYELVDADERDALVDAHRDLVSRAREFDGCIHVAITADSVDPERINSVEVWRDAGVMEDWRRQANAPDTPEAKYADVKRYDATDGGPLF